MCPELLGVNCPVAVQWVSHTSFTGCGLLSFVKFAPDCRLKKFSGFVKLRSLETVEFGSPIGFI
jgi:hypothetical protein